MHHFDKTKSKTLLSSHKLTSLNWSRRHFTMHLASGFGGIVASSVMLPSAHAVLDTLKRIAMPSPKTTFLDANGNPARLADWLGTPLLVNFWATWCPPCIHELPSLMRLDQHLRQHDMAVLLISVDRAGRDKAIPFLENLGITGPELGFDPNGDLAKSVDIKALPTSYCIRADGVIAAQIIGDMAWDDAPVIETIMPYLSA